MSRSRIGPYSVKKFFNSELKNLTVDVDPKYFEKSNRSKIVDNNLEYVKKLNCNENILTKYYDKIKEICPLLSDWEIQQLVYMRNRISKQYVLYEYPKISQDSINVLFEVLKK